MSYMYDKNVCPKNSLKPLILKDFLLNADYCFFSLLYIKSELTWNLDKGAFVFKNCSNQVSRASGRSPPGGSHRSIQPGTSWDHIQGKRKSRACQPYGLKACGAQYRKLRINGTTRPSPAQPLHPRRSRLSGDGKLNCPFGDRGWPSSARKLC